MATLVCFHAHPDDESMTTGGVMAKYAALVSGADRGAVCEPPGA